MSGWVKALVGLAALAFVMAVVTELSATRILTTAEGWSRASSNLSLLVIALVLVYSSRPGPG